LIGWAVFGDFSGILVEAPNIEMFWVKLQLQILKRKAEVFIFFINKMLHKDCSQGINLVGHGLS
jgi:hypothetical protein